MKHYLLDLLGCPVCKSDLQLSGAEEVSGEIKKGVLNCSNCNAAYPIIRFIPRFVPAENYSNNFGFQWNRFEKTQLDSYTKTAISHKRYYSSTGWRPEELEGKVILDVGCGAGRFSEVSLSAGGRLVALDYSSAVDACYKNLGANVACNVVQGDIYNLPFKSEVFDYVYCLGVLQHTPDVEMAFKALKSFIKPGGKLSVDVYPKLFRNIFWPKYWLRPLTKHKSPEELFEFIRKLIKYLLPVSRLISKIPLVGKKLRYLVPIANYEGVYPLSDELQREWSLLDTFDMYSPMYDSPQTVGTLAKWFTQEGYIAIKVFRKGHLIGQGTKSK